MHIINRVSIGLNSEQNKVFRSYFCFQIRWYSLNYEDLQKTATIFINFIFQTAQSAFSNENCEKPCKKAFFAFSKFEINLIYVNNARLCFYHIFFLRNVPFSIGNIAASCKNKFYCTMQMFSIIHNNTVCAIIFFHHISLKKFNCFVQTHGLFYIEACKHKKTRGKIFSLVTFTVYTNIKIKSNIYVIWLNQTCSIQ